MSFSKFTQQDYALITREYAALKELARLRCASSEELDTVQRAFDFANEAHKDVRRRSGEPYILHPIAVAKIVISDIGLGYKSIVAALLHDVVEDTAYTTEDIRNLFGEKIASLVDGLTKIKTVLDNENKDHNMLLDESIQAENLKRILLTLNDDVRVVLIKLADRLHNCRTIEFMPEHKREKILSETMFIFIPLAHRLGLYSIKSEMENIWLRYKEPEAYNDISARISQNVEAREKEIESFVAPINDALRRAGFEFKILKRIKTPYSIWRKMRTKHITFDEIYDLYAVRIVFNPSAGSNETERDQCYHVFSIITSLYRYQPERMRDWVKQPKSNGYEALHCTLMSHSGVWIEVQIRTKRMDDIAEKGIAAHWAYKREGFVSENDSEMDNWLAKVKEILSGSNLNALELLDIIHEDLTYSEIVVFTPKGEQKTIQNGATALDFAYQIHTEIGNKAIAAKVNQKLVPLSQKLKAGDVVEIISADSSTPKVEWFQFLRTRHAINLAMDYFRSHDTGLIMTGRQKLEDVLRLSGQKINNDVLKRLLAGTQLAYIDELYFRIAIGVITIDRIKKILADPQYDNAKNPIRSRDYKGNPFYIAPCCSPIPGDPVIGIRRPGGVLTIHKKTCPEADKIASKHGDWVVVPEWSDLKLQTVEFSSKIGIKGIDRVGLLNEITQYISLKMGVNIRSITLKSDSGVCEGYIDILVKDRSILDDIIRKIESIDGINTVTRTDM